MARWPQADAKFSEQYGLRSFLQQCKVSRIGRLATKHGGLGGGSGGVTPRQDTCPPAGTGASVALPRLTRPRTPRGLTVLYLTGGAEPASEAVSREGAAHWIHGVCPGSNQRIHVVGFPTS